MAIKLDVSGGHSNTDLVFFNSAETRFRAKG